MDYDIVFAHIMVNICWPGWVIFGCASKLVIFPCLECAQRAPFRCKDSTHQVLSKGLGEHVVYHHWLRVSNMCLLYIISIYIRAARYKCRHIWIWKSSFPKIPSSMLIFPNFPDNTWPFEEIIYYVYIYIYSTCSNSISIYIYITKYFSSSFSCLGVAFFP